VNAVLLAAFTTFIRRMDRYYSFLLSHTPYWIIIKDSAWIVLYTHSTYVLIRRDTRAVVKLDATKYFHIES
jgi:hypothetical protein